MRQEAFTGGLHVDSGFGLAPIRLSPGHLRGIVIGEAESGAVAEPGGHGRARQAPDSAGIARRYAPGVCSNS